MNKTKISHTLLSLGISGALGMAAGARAVDLSKLPPASTQQGVTFAKDIKPLFEASCIRCHGDQRPKGGLRLGTLENVLKGSKEGKVVEPGNSEKSDLLIAVAQLDPETAMPPKPRARKRGGGPGGPGGPGGGPGDPGPMGTNGPAGGPGRPPAPPPKPLTPEQVGLVRAWIDQGAK